MAGGTRELGLPEHQWNQSGVRVTGKKGGCGEVSVQEAFPVAPHSWCLLLEEVPSQGSHKSGAILGAKDMMAKKN